MGKHGLKVLRERHGLSLLKGCREALEQELLRACIGPSNEELHRVIERLLPRGKLTLAIRNDAPATDALPPDAAQ